MSKRERYRLPDLATLVPPRAEAASLAEKAYFLIRDRIITLQLAPGATIDERALMAELDLGRTPIREALRRLGVERLVEVVPRRGMFVAHLDLRDLGAISEIRLELEGHAARLAAERATPEQRATADDLLDLLDRAAADQISLIQADQWVHRHLHACTQNPYFVKTLDEYFVLSLRLWFVVLDRVSRLDAAVAEHRALLEAVRDGDPDQAEKVLRAHVAGFEQEIRRVL